MHLWIQCIPVRVSRPQRSFDSSTGLFAVFHALLRLLAPRHPPHALSSLAALILPSLAPISPSDLHPQKIRDPTSQDRFQLLGPPRLLQSGWPRIQKVTIHFSLGSCRDSQETPRLRLSPKPCCCLCNFYRCRIVKELPPAKLAFPNRNHPGTHSFGVACCAGSDARLLWKLISQAGGAALLKQRSLQGLAAATVCVT